MGYKQQGRYTCTVHKRLSTDKKVKIQKNSCAPLSTQMLATPLVIALLGYNCKVVLKDKLIKRIPPWQTTD